MNKFFCYKKFKFLLINPFFLFGIFTLILSFILAVGIQFKIPNFFTNKELAYQIAQTVSSSEVPVATEHLFNPKYHFWNNIFQFWAWSFVIFIFCLFFKINKYIDFIHIKIFNNKYFIYLWANISYPIFGLAFLLTYMSDLEKYVYNNAADTFAIPFFSLLSTIFMFSIIYIPVVNLLIYVTYNTKIKRFFYNIIWYILIFLLLILIIICFNYLFNYFILCIDFIILMWFILILHSIKKLKVM